MSPAAARASVYASLTRTRERSRMTSVVAVTMTNGANGMGGRAVAWLLRRSVSYTQRYPRPTSPMVFDGFRRSFEELLDRATRPEERRVVASRMKETLVQARMGLDDLRDGPREGSRSDSPPRSASSRPFAAASSSPRESTIARRSTSPRSTRRCTASGSRSCAQKVAAQEAELALAERDVGDDVGGAQGGIVGSGSSWRGRCN